MFIDNKPYTFDRVVRIGFAVALLCGLVWLLGYLSDVLIPFVVALLLAYIMNPLVRWFEKRIKNRVAAVFISLFLIISLLIFIGWIVIPLIMNEIANTGRVLTRLAGNAELAEKAAKRLPPDLWQALKDYAARAEVQEFFKTENFWKIAETAARRILPGVWGVITGTASFIMGIVGLSVIGLYLVFLLLDYRKVSEGWQDLIPSPYRNSVTGFVNDFDSAMNRYFRGQASVAAIVGIMFAVGFYLIDMPMGILLGLFIGLLNMVPYLQILGLIPAFLLALVHALDIGTSFWVMLGLTGLVFAIIQLFQDAVLVPKIMGRVTGLSPAMILLSLSVWGKLLGIFGLLIALPMTFLLFAYYKRFLISIKSDDLQTTGSTL